MRVGDGGFEKDVVLVRLGCLTVSCVAVGMTRGREEEEKVLYDNVSTRTLDLLIRLLTSLRPSLFTHP